ncbi:non-ribosomal peptide synthetase [Algoriphagus antarcticus]|uniref:Amino acid adenylation domain-containing protein n=1 Tax=Algoriphagus antarcticus TaxID=238540 RepID=A0A3E0EBF4_9BACT|nr:non-ribosomal peptide synthetase [Algoriphagus antarcticus]REG94569.1 amino acid adenylation domain-containing protein [Algoriphagus antarcticus]
MRNQIIELLAPAFNMYREQKAIVFNNQSISYSELDQRIHSLAEQLKINVPSESIIAVSCKRSIETIVNLLAVLAAGKTYLPIDFDLPTERIQTIVSEAKSSYFLPSVASESFESLGLKSIYSNDSGKNKEIVISKYAYVLFTSGSTGVPKGVCMPHEALLNLVEWQNNISKSTVGFKTLHFAKLTFDASFQEIFCSLGTGGTLHIVSNETIKDPYLLLNYIEQQNINRLFLPFVALQALANTANSYQIYPSGLIEVMTAGEQLKITESIRNFFSEIPDCDLFNQYGPTESHVVTQLHLQGSPSSWEELPTIGLPIQNSRVDIVNDEGNIITKAGEIGELYLSGVCLAGGYLNREELTLDKFVMFTDKENSSYRVYKSGDLGYWNENGEIGFVSRRDDQVKISGFRVELGEIELAASKVPGVDECAVVKAHYSDSQLYLKLYYTSSSESITVDVIWTQLSRVLPEYMVPSKISKLEKMPKTTSGKVDRKKLSTSIDNSTSTTNSSSESPRIGLESDLALLWNKILPEQKATRESYFFDLGGSSIFAQMLSLSIKDTLNVHFPVALIYQYPSIKKQAEYLSKFKTSELIGNETMKRDIPDFIGTSKDVNSPPFQGAEIGLDKEGNPYWIKAQKVSPNKNIPDREIPKIEKVIPITPSQMEIWLACKLGGKQASKAYNESVSLNLTGVLSVKILEDAFLKVIGRHEAMRSIVSPNGKSFIIFKTYSQPINLTDISDLSAYEKDTFLEKHIEQTGLFDFNLTHGPLYVMDLIKLDEKEFLLTFTGHHLIFDGWSLDVMIEELGALYSAYMSGNEHKLPKAYLLGDYSKEVFNLMSRPSFEKTKEFWQDYLSNPVPILDLPIDNERTNSRTYNSKVHKKRLKDETLNKVRAIGAKLNSSLNLTLMSVFEIFLHEWTKQNDIIVGIPIAGQLMLNKHCLIGHCVSLLPLRSKIDRDLTFSDYLKIRKSDYYKALQHSSISFGEMIQYINLPRDSSRIPLIPVTLNIDKGTGNVLEFKGLNHDLKFNAKSYVNFELVLDLFETSDGHVIDWTYNSNLFNKSTIEAAADRFFEMIDLFIENPDEKISGIVDLLSIELEESKIVLDDFEPLGELIKKQLSSNKDKMAVRVGGKEYTYEYLNNITNSISQQLLLKGVGPGKIVGVHLDRTIELVASALAVVQVGACYMPIDAELPEDRVKFMLNDVNVKAFITDKDNYSWDKLNDRKIQMEKGMFLKQSPDFIAKLPTAEDPLFIVYTSGSTGNPKGVLLSQQNLADFLKHFKQAPGLNEDDHVLGLTSISFDMSFMELILPFVYGASLYLFDRFERRDPREIVKAIKTQGITKLFATPSHLKSIVEYGLTEKQEKLTIISAGEPLQLSLAQALVKASAKVYNIYGPTETTIYTNIKEITSETEKVTIGKPVEGTDIFLLDEKGNIVTKSGELGEVYIGGKGVGIGYLNRKELTQEKFISYPLPNKPNRYYKTGDLAVWTEDRELICKGRIDHQVKIRGQRVELGEIENMIARDNEIENVIVEKIIDENGDDSLVAFISFKKNKRGIIDSSNWIDSCKQNLSRVLSSFMIPANFLVVDDFQLNQNGKIDRRALRSLIHTSVEEVENQIVPPILNIGSSDTIFKVKKMWEDVLITRDPKLDADFFQIGGHSLLAVDLISKIEKKFDINLPLSFLFEYSTINSISRKLDQLLLNDVVESGVLVKIKDGIPDKVLFFIHGVGLNPLEIKTLINYMDEDQTIWGLQSPTILNSKIDPIDTIEDIAERYLFEIKKNGFTGPYNLLGNSIGGQIAFEMAKQLLRQGEKIAFLGMIDTTATLPSEVPKTMPSKIKNFSKKMLFELKFLFDDPVYYKKYRVNSLKEKLDKFRNPIADEDLGNLKARISQIENVNMDAWRKYKHEHINANVTLFLAKKKTFYVSDFKTFGWSPYVNAIHIIHMPGEHANMLKAPHGAEFSKALQIRLNSSNI